MKKRFNSTGVCVSRKHYMVDISDKLEQIKKLIDNEFYFTINIYYEKVLLKFKENNTKLVEKEDLDGFRDVK